MTGHEIGLLKGYMQDLIEQGRQESMVSRTAGYREQNYTPDQAVMDLLALLDDRMESEGVQVGLPQDFPHKMWEIFRQAEKHIKDTAWIAENLDPHGKTTMQVRTIAYKALIEHIEKDI